MTAPLIVACVWSGGLFPGAKYTIEDVRRLKRMVDRHLKGARFVCLTDHNPEPEDGVEFVNYGHLGLPGWWLKMALFRQDWRRDHRVIYLDLDTLIINSLQPLADLDQAAQFDFGICENWTRRAGNTTWPCRYGSCVMVLGARLSNRPWKAFHAHQKQFLSAYVRYGDQRAIEDVLPEAVFLQAVLPYGFMIGYRELRSTCPETTAIVNFGGKNKADNSEFEWVRKAWQAA